MSKEKKTRRMVGYLFRNYKKSIGDRIEGTGKCVVYIGKFSEGGNEHKITKENYSDYFPKDGEDGKQISLNKLVAEDDNTIWYFDELESKK